MLLVLKLFLVPALVGLVSVAVQRWGPRTGGVVASLPVVAGPALLFLSIEQGTAFAAEAARGTLAALAAVAGAGLAYGWAARRAAWWLSLPASWACFIALTLALHAVDLGTLPALGVALLSFAASRALLPPVRAARVRTAPALWDLPLRMVSSMVLVLLVTGLAARLGPGLTGALTPFPVTLTVLLAFTHARDGTGTMVRFLQGFLPGMWSFAVFCFMAAILLPPLGAGAGFALALAVQVVVQTVILVALRAGPPRLSPGPAAREP